MTDDLQFLKADKDTSKSCVFAWPDRPIDSFPPDYPPGTPPDDYPYDPTLDWPFIPPISRPVPGSDPYPSGSPIPPINPSATFAQHLPYFYKGEDEIPQYGGGEGMFHTEVDPAVINVGAVVHVALANKLTPRDIAGPFLLTETGFSIEAAAFGNPIQNDSGLFLYYVEKSNGSAIYYLCYYAHYFNGITSDNFISFAPCGITRVTTITPGVLIQMADFEIGPLTLPPIGIPPAQTVVTKTFSTACIYVPNKDILYPDIATIS